MWENQVQLCAKHEKGVDLLQVKLDPLRQRHLPDVVLATPVFPHAGSRAEGLQARFISWLISLAHPME